MVRLRSAFALAGLCCTSLVNSLKNPILPGWNPDPHVLRVEDTYYVAVSSFQSFPGIPTYKSKNLADWELVSHAIDSPEKVPLNGIRLNNGIWAPSLSYINGLFYATSMAMWGSDPTYRTWPRFFWVSSPDLKTWSDVVWAEPYGIDPHLYQDPVSKKNYLSVMGLNNNFDAIWGISQCEVDLDTGKCLGPYRNTWNGTLPVSASARPEGPKLFLKDGYYYMIAAEGGTGATHRATIARSKAPDGPWESSPTNPLIFNGANLNLTVGSTGHATFADTPDGRWFATFLARRNVQDWAVLGREAFFAPVEWNDDGWPVVNGGEPILLSQSYDYGPDQEYPAEPYEDHFEGDELRLSWYQLRSPYTKNYRLASLDKTASNGTGRGGVILKPNVFTLTDRDTPAAILRKQTSVNMTFETTLLPTDKGFGHRQTLGLSVYSHEGSHHDIGVRGCVNAKDLCIYYEGTINGPGPGTPPNQSVDYPLGLKTIPKDLKLHVRAEPLRYRLGYSLSGGDIEWIKEFHVRDLRLGFDGTMFALFASGNSLPWPYDAPEVGFKSIREEYFDEGFKDYRY